MALCKSVAKSGLGVPMGVEGVIDGWRVGLATGPVGVAVLILKWGGRGGWGVEKPHSPLPPYGKAIVRPEMIFCSQIGEKWSDYKIGK